MKHKTHNANHRTRILRVCLILLILIVSLFGVLLHLISERDRIHEKAFPEWRDAIEPQKESYSEVTLTLMGIDFNVTNTASDVKAEDMVHIRAVITGENSVSHGEEYWLDYFYEGKWYTVSCPGSGIDRCAFYSPGEHNLTFCFPAGVFQKAGQYRIYVDTLGYCEYDNILPDK